MISKNLIYFSYLRSPNTFILKTIIIAESIVQGYGGFAVSDI